MKKIRVIISICCLLLFSCLFTGCFLGNSNNNQDDNNQNNNNQNQTVVISTINCKKSSGTYAKYYFIVEFTNNTDNDVTYALSGFQTKILDFENNDELIATSDIYAKEYNKSTGTIGNQYGNNFTVDSKDSCAVVFYIKDYAGTPMLRLRLTYNNVRISQFDVNAYREIINII